MTRESLMARGCDTIMSILRTQLWAQNSSSFDLSHSSR